MNARSASARATASVVASQKPLPSWVYELSEPVWPGDWREPDWGQERLDDLERAHDRDERGVQEMQ